VYVEHLGGTLVVVSEDTDENQDLSLFDRQTCGDARRVGSVVGLLGGYELGVGEWQGPDLGGLEVDDASATDTNEPAFEAALAPELVEVLPVP